MGFGHLQGMNGVQKFTVSKAYGNTNRLPAAHTWYFFFFSHFIYFNLFYFIFLFCFCFIFFYLFFLITDKKNYLNSFNQLDLPEYETYEQLRHYLLLAINEGSVGFGFG